jgi:hypothetical protein
LVTTTCVGIVHFLPILLLVYLSPKIRKITQNLIHIHIGFTIQSNDKRSLRYKQLTVYIVLGITILLFASSITASSPSSFLYAQQQQQQLTQNTTPTTPATLAIGVKITSPARGQQVPVGSLTISGTSKVTANSNDCTVYAIWDHLKPYQKVKPTGIGGIDDYSNWAFTYTSAYHLITNGTNQLTAKISCLASPSSSTTTAVSSSSSSSTNLTKWYSINVTGITSRVNQTKTPVPIATTTITTNNTNINSTNTTTSATASTPSTTPSLLPFPVSKVNLNNNNKNNNDDNGDQSGNPGNQDKKSSSNENDNNKKKASNNKNNDDDHDDSKTDNSSSKPHKKHDNSKSKTTTHHHDDHSKKNTKHIIKEKTKEVKHKIKHLKKQMNKEISKHI